MRIFITFAILSVVLAIALPVVVLIVSLNLRAQSGIPFALAVSAAPFVCVAGIILGAILQIVYKLILNFITAKSLFTKLKKYTILRNENGNFLVFFKQKRLFHKLEIRFLEDKICSIKHSTNDTMQNQNWHEKFSQEISIDKAEYKNLDLEADINFKALFAFLSFCTTLTLDNSKTILLHRGSSNFAFSNDSQIPKEIKHLKKQEDKNKLKRFSAFVAVIIALFLSVHLYFQSAFYPCSVFNATLQGDVKKMESLLKSGVNPNARCMPNTFSFDEIFNKIFELIFVDILHVYTSIKEDLGPTALDIAMQYYSIQKTNNYLFSSNDVRRAMITSKFFWTNLKSKSNFKSEAMIELLMKYGATTSEYDLPQIFEYGSKELIELFLAKGAFNGSREQSEYILKSALSRDTQSLQEYEEILELALNIVPYKELKQEILDNVVCYKAFGKAKILLKNGANINTRNCPHADTILISTLKEPFSKEALDFIIYLLEQGANVNLINEQGQSALDIFNQRVKVNPNYSSKSEDVIDKIQNYFLQDRTNKILKIKELLYQKGAKSGVQLQKTKKIQKETK